MTSLESRTARSKQGRFQFSIQFLPHLGDPLIPKLPKQRGWEVVFNDRAPRGILVKDDPQGCVESRSEHMPCSHGSPVAQGDAAAGARPVFRLRLQVIHGGGR